MQSIVSWGEHLIVDADYTNLRRIYTLFIEQLFCHTTNAKISYYFTLAVLYSKGISTHR